MSIRVSMGVVALISCAPIPLVPGAAVAQVSPMYVNCQYGFAVIFPSPPMTRDIRYTTASGTTVPARQFYVERGNNSYIETVVDFSSGPKADEAIVEHAASVLRSRGETRFQAQALYDPGMPGRQLNIFERNGRQLRASVYMAEHRLFITEASAAIGDTAALMFEQSITLVDSGGTDLDRAAPSGEETLRTFPCR